MLIGVVSDTHIPSRARRIPPRVIAGLRGVDLILHAGDLTELSVLAELRAIAPVEAVVGNVDSLEVMEALPRTRILDVDGRRIGLVHGDGPGPSTPARVLRAFAGIPVDAIVFGHSHAPLCEHRDGLLLFNPGSPTDKRRQPRASYGLLRVEGEELTAEIVYI